MSITFDTHLPTEEELTVQEINVSSVVLKAGAFHLGKACEFENNEFVLCRHETKDPRACIAEGKAVTNCALKFFRMVKKTCSDEFHQYANCLDKSSGNAAFAPCRKTQAVFDKCMLDNNSMERPHFGYFAQAQVHKSARPEPPPPQRPEYPDPTPYLPKEVETPPAKYGSRWLFSW